MAKFRIIYLTRTDTFQGRYFLIAVNQKTKCLQSLFDFNIFDRASVRCLLSHPELEKTPLFGSLYYTLPPQISGIEYFVVLYVVSKRQF